MRKNIENKAAVIALLIGLAFALPGCSSIAINDSNAPELFAQFSAGTLRLKTGFTAVGTNIFHVEDMYFASASKDWAGLSKIVIQANSGDDVGYFYLGLAAEKLGYKSAARTYYQLSIDDSRYQTLPTQCTRRDTPFSYLGDKCHGLELPDAAIQRLDALH
jgi:hypothetical protein